MPKQQKARAKGAKRSRRDKPSNKNQAFRTERNKRLKKEKDARLKAAAKIKVIKVPRGTARMKAREAGRQCTTPTS